MASLDPAWPDQASTAFDVSSVPLSLIPDLIPDHLRRTASDDQIAQLAHDPPTRDRRIDHRCQALAHHVIDDVEHPEASPGDELVVDEVQAPALVGKRQHRRRGPRADGAPSSLPAAHRQSCRGNDPPDQCLVRPDPHDRAAGSSCG